MTENNTPEQQESGVFKGLLIKARRIRDLLIAGINQDIATAETITKGASNPTENNLVEELKRLINEAATKEAEFETKSERLSKEYIIPDRLRQAIKLSKFLSKPLLLEGEPGTGKTALAYALAAEEYDKLIHVRGKTELRAETILYHIDNLARLRDASANIDIPNEMREESKRWSNYLDRGGNPENTQLKVFLKRIEASSILSGSEQVSNIENYVRFGALGEAIIRAARGEKVILLLDEIDKTKQDFPNNLLDEIEYFTLRIEELGIEISAPKENILIIITSNNERKLPDPFLRRCVHHYIDFPDPEQMTMIIKSHLGDNIGEHLLQTALDRFYEIRNSHTLKKSPSTSELIDWVKALIEFGIEEVGEEFPFPELLLKTAEDYDLLAGKTAREKAARKLAQSKTPEYLHAVLDGKVVVRLLPTNPGFTGRSTPDERIEVILANKRVPFTTYQNNYDDVVQFDIKLKGITKVDTLTFAFDKNEPEAKSILDKLMAEYLIDILFETTENEKVDFQEVIRSNGSFIEGIDSDGNLIYLLLDSGLVIRANKIGFVKDGAFGDVGLTYDQVEDLRKNSIYDPNDLYKRLKENGDEEILNIRGFGPKTLAKIKSFFSRDEDYGGDNRESLGEVTLAKIRDGGKTLFDEANDQDDDAY